MDVRAGICGRNFRGEVACPALLSDDGEKTPRSVFRRVAKAADLSDGQRVEIVSSHDEIVIRKLPTEVTGESMFAGRSARDWRTLYRAAYDWGPNQGRERIED